MDPRYIAIEKRLDRVRRIVAVTGGKGGIGKSVVSSTLAVLLANAGRSTGLLDLDLTGPTDHVILGLDDRFPTERFGIEPPEIAGVRFMSVSYFVRERPTPLRGADVTNALVEILAITRWQELDVLVVDMPPGLGDATLDAVRFLPRAEYLVVGTGSRLVRETVRRALEFLVGLGVRVCGVVENMRRGDGEDMRELAARFGAPFLGSIAWDDGLEAGLGDPVRLVRTSFASQLGEIGKRLLAADGRS